MPAWQNQPVEAIRYLPGGYGNANYRFSMNHKEFVLRIPGIRQPYVDRHHELRWYQQLPAGIGPQIIALDPVTGDMISRWIDGQLLADFADEVTPNELVSFLHTLHSQLPEPQRHYDIEVLNDTFWPDGAPYSVAPASAPPAAGISLSACHNDLNPWNVIVTDDGWYTIDWEFAGNNDPLFDLVTLFLGLNRPAAELLPAAAAYLQMHGGGAEAPLVQRVRAVQRTFWLRELGWAEHQIRQGNTRPEIVDQAAHAAQQLKHLFG